MTSLRCTSLQFVCFRIAIVTFSPGTAITVRCVVTRAYLGRDDIDLLAFFRVATVLAYVSDARTRLLFYVAAAARRRGRGATSRRRPAHRGNDVRKYRRLSARISRFILVAPRDHCSTPLVDTFLCVRCQSISARAFTFTSTADESNGAIEHRANRGSHLRRESGVRPPLPPSPALCPGASRFDRNLKI